jgi:hypothetical protein
MMPFSHKPMSMGGCGPHHWGPPVRECHRKCKELLVEPTAQEGRTGATGTGQAIIGGGCCVQLSVEYMPAQPVITVDSPTDQKCAVTVVVVDSEGCSLTWHKVFQEGYHVKESIITTYPGARLGVQVNNAIARVRWCEVFSC